MDENEDEIDTVATTALLTLLCSVWVSENLIVMAIKLMLAHAGRDGFKALNCSLTPKEF